MSQISRGLVVFVGFVSGVLLTGNAGAANRNPPCVLMFAEGALCYAPSRLPQAEARLHFAPVDPSFAVRSVTGLHLSQVIFAGNRTVGEIYFIYGTIPMSGHGGIPLPSPRFPKWVVVSEGGHPSGPWRVDRTVWHLANGKPRYDPWNLYANHLDVTGNFAKAKIRRMGLMVLHRSAAKQPWLLMSAHLRGELMGLRRASEPLGPIALSPLIGDVGCIRTSVKLSAVIRKFTLTFCATFAPKPLRAVIRRGFLLDRKEFTASASQK